MSNVLIIYANDQYNRLSMLEKESKEIDRILDRMTHKDYSVRIMPGIESVEFIEELTRNGHELQVLHYSGHANAQNLIFSNQDVNSSSLADRLGMCKNLKLVFLNGCATNGQVAFFHKAGIPFVIATSRQVGDTKAFWIATQFYQYLTLGKNLKEAFELVRKDGIVLNMHLDIEYRGIGFVDDAESDKKFEWGLYAAKDAEPYLLPIKQLFKRNSLEKLPFYNDGIRNASLNAIQHGNCTVENEDDSMKNQVERVMSAADYASVFLLLEGKIGEDLKAQYNTLKQSFEYYLNQGFMPTPAVLQGLKIFLSKLFK